MIDLISIIRHFRFLRQIFAGKISDNVILCFVSSPRGHALAIGDACVSMTVCSRKRQGGKFPFQVSGTLPYWMG
jgi:hypothetical protein